MLTSDKNLSTSLREYEKITDCPGDTGIGVAVSILLTIVMPSALDRLRGFHLDKFIENWRKSNERMEHEQYPEIPKKNKK